MLEWVWRVPFMARVVLTLLGALLGHKIAADTPCQSPRHAAPSLAVCFRLHWRSMRAMGLTDATAGVTEFVRLMCAVPWTVCQAGVATGLAQGVNGAILLLCTAATPAAGRLGDAIGWRRAVMLGAAVGPLGVWPAFLCFKTGTPPVIPGSFRWAITDANRDARRQLPHRQGCCQSGDKWPSRFPKIATDSLQAPDRA